MKLSELQSLRKRMMSYVYTYAVSYCSKEKSTTLEQPRVDSRDLIPKCQIQPLTSRYLVDGIVEDVDNGLEQFGCGAGGVW